MEFIHDANIEKAVLSVVLQDEDKVDDLLRLGVLDMFHVPSHKRLLEIMIDRRNKGKSNELIQLTKKLVDEDILDDLGGPSAITEIYTFSSTSRHFEDHIKLLLDIRVKRKAQILSLKLKSAAHEEDTQEISKVIESSLSDMFLTKTDEVSNKKLVGDIISNLQGVLNGQEEEGLEFGFPELQRKIGRFKGNELVIVAARPGSGKTSFMMNIVEAISMENNEPSLIFSLEMTKKSLAERYIYGSAGVNFRALANQKPSEGKRTLSKEEIHGVKASAMKFANSPVRVHDESAITLEKLSAIARSDVKKRGTKIILLDYIQIMSANKKLPREQQVSEISAGLKTLSKELDVPIIALCQLNRMSEQRSNGIPKASDLRESGSLEQDADKVILLHRLINAAETPEDRMEAADKALIISAKCRGGETGIVQARFIAERFKFMEVGRQTN